MQPLAIYFATVTKSMKTGPAIVDISEDLAAVVKASGIADGVAHLFSIGSTGSLTTIEYESGVVEDLKRAINELAPPDLDYEHDKAWHDGNGHSHVQAALLGPSLSLPIRKGGLAHGTWQQVVLINHDNRARRRRVEITIVGAGFLG